MKETAHLLRSTRIVTLILGLMLGATLVITGLSHTTDVGLFGKEHDVRWNLVLIGSIPIAVTPLVCVALSWAEAVLTFLEPLRLPNLVLRPADDFENHVSTAPGFGTKMHEAMEAYGKSSDPAGRKFAPGYAADHTEG